MTKAEFDMLLNNAASGKVSSMRGIAMLCFKMAEGVMAHDIRKATIFIELGNGWKELSESGFTDFGNELDQVKIATREAFSNSF